MCTVIENFLAARGHEKPYKKKKKITQAFKTQLYKKKVPALYRRFLNYIIWFNDLSLKVH